jgi:hypothetical protein
MVHRLLAVSIAADHMSPEMLDKGFSHQTCKNLNYRNRMAQYAGRASVALHTHVSWHQVALVFENDVKIFSDLFPEQNPRRAGLHFVCEEECVAHFDS